MKYIPSSELEIRDIPLVSANIKTIMEFALTFNPVVEITEGEKMPTFNDGFDAISQRMETLTLPQLRYILYFEQRRWNHRGREPDTETENNIRNVVAQITSRVKA